MTQQIQADNFILVLCQCCCVFTRVRVFPVVDSTVCFAKNNYRPDTQKLAQRGKQGPSPARTKTL